MQNRDRLEALPGSENLVNLFEDIKFLETHISDLKYKLKYSKDKNKDNNTILRLSAVLSNYNKVLNHNFYLDSLNAVILTLVREKMKADQILYPSRDWMYRTASYIGQVLRDGYPYALAELSSAIYLSYEKIAMDNGDPLSTAISREEVEQKIMEMVGNIKSDIQWIAK